MYNLLIVDDESGILEWLQELFTYNCSEEIEVHTAGSGRKAIDVLNRVKCDVVLTDIKMPGMSGVELYGHIQENWPRAKVIFLTGYRDHETLYELSQNKGVRYLLKMESDEKIMETVQDALKEIEREKEEFVQANQRDTLLKKAQYWLQKEYLEQFLSRRETKSEKEAQAACMQGRLDELQISICAEFPLLMFLGRTSVEERAVFCEEQSRVMEIIRETMPGILKITCWMTDTGYLPVLVQPKLLDEAVDWKRIFKISMGALEDIQEFCQRSIGIGLSFAAGREPVLLKEMEETYFLLKNGLHTLLGDMKEAAEFCQRSIGIGLSFAAGREPVLLKEMEETYFLLKNGLHTLLGDMKEAAICIPEPKNQSSEAESQGVSCLSVLFQLPRLEEYLEQGKRVECEQVLSELTRPLLSGVSRHDMGALELYYNISMVYLKKINSGDLKNRIPFRIGLYKLTGAELFDSWQEAVDYLRELNGIIFDLLGEEGMNRTDLVILKVEEYIRSHLSQDLTLTALADVAGFNAAYLSRIFKAKYHMNLSEYVARERVKEAGKLLVETGEKINRIGEMVGYPTPHSFTRVFKASEGMSPVEYRNRFRQ